MKSFKQYIKEANHGTVTLYDDNAPKSDDKIRVTPEKVHKWVRKHQANLYTLNHIQQNLGPDNPNLKIHYTNQMAIATRKRDYWLNAKIPGSGGAHYYDRSKAKEDTHLARNISHGHLTELGYNNLPEPPKLKPDPKVANLPTTKDGRKLFGV